MLQRIIAYFLRRRHFWRYVEFDELAELYISIMIRNVGVSLIGIFIPIYLYKLGYDLSSILLFLAIFSVGRVGADLLGGYLSAHDGPKHTMLYSYLFQIVALAQLLSLPSFGWPLWSIALMFAMANSLFFIAFHIDFSKVMHHDHGGKELGFMSIVERVGGVLGPVAGGLIASFFGAEWVIWIAIGLLVIAVTPLFLSAEPTQTRQHLDFKSFPMRRLWRDYISWGAIGIENHIALNLWPLFIAITIFTTNTYAGVGLVTSLGIATGLLTAKAIGQLIDAKRGGLLLRYSAIGNSLVHFARPFTSTFTGTIAINVANEAVTTGYRLPYIRGMYDRADRLPGYRIVYLICMEMVSDTSKAAAWFALWLLSLVLTPVITMQAGFVLAGVIGLFILMQRYPALKRR